MFAVYHSPSLLASDYKYLPYARVDSFRKELNGLGASEITVDLRDYSDPNFNEGDENYTNIGISVNDWILIVNTDVSGKSTPDSSAGITDKDVVWWGYVSNFSWEMSKGFKQFRGNMTCYEFGHYLRTQSITFENSTLEKSAIQKGFNPVNEGHYLGNCDNSDYENEKKRLQDIADTSKKLLDETPQNHPAYASRLESYENDIKALNNFSEKSTGYAPKLLKFNLGTDPLKDVKKYWTPLRLIKFATVNACKYNMEFNPDNISLETNRFLDTVETFDSIEGKDFIQVVDELLDPLKVIFEVTSTSYISVKLVDVKKPVSNYIYQVDQAVSDFRITNEESKYDKVILNGDRVLVSATVTTYAPSGGNIIYGLKRGWTDEQTKAYVNILGDNKTYTDLVDEYNQYANGVKDDIEQDNEEYKKKLIEQADDKFKKILKTYETARQKYQNVYQEFQWQTGATEGDGSKVLFTCSNPGYKDKGSIFPIFPLYKFQPNGYGDSLNGVDSIRSSFAVGGEPENLSLDNSKSSYHATPGLSEMEFEDFIPVENYTTFGEATFTGVYNKNMTPTFFYRSLGYEREYDGETHNAPVWYDGTLQTDGLMSSEMNCYWYGFKLKSPYPECFGCGDVEIFKDPYGGSSWEFQDYGMTRGEWSDSLGVKGTSEYDPDSRTYAHKGHWGRMVFTFSAYSSQRVSVYAGNFSGEKVKEITDDSYKMWVLRKGLVYRVKDTYNVAGIEWKYPDIINSLDPLPQDKIVRNDLKFMQDDLILYWQYYGRDKRALRIEQRMFDENGKTLNPQVKIGDFWNVVRDGNGSMNVNSYVASVEYLLDLGKPRIVITTEYPASPERTRRRQIKWGQGMQMNPYHEKWRRERNKQ